MKVVIECIGQISIKFYCLLKLDNCYHIGTNQPSYDPVLYDCYPKVLSDFEPKRRG